MSNTIRIPVITPYDGMTCIDITPDIARQIVALSGEIKAAYDLYDIHCDGHGEDMQRTEELEKRIAALEQWAKRDADMVAQAVADLDGGIPANSTPVAADKPAPSWGGVSGGGAGAGILQNAERPAVFGPGDDDYGRRKPFVPPDLTDEQKDNLRKSLTEIRVQAQPVADPPAGDDAAVRIPCGICNEPVLRGLHGSFAEYHDCKPVPGAKLDKALADLAAMTERALIAERRAKELNDELNDQCSEIRGAKADAERAKAERDALRALLRESVTCFNGLYLEQKRMRERIDAALVAE